MVIAPSFLPWDLARHLCDWLTKLGVIHLPLATQAYQNPAGVRRALLAACHRNDPDIVFGSAPRGLQKAVLERAESFEPDLIVCLALNRLSPSTLKALKSPVVGWYVDCFSEHPPAWMKSRLGQLCVFFTSAQEMVAKYADWAATPVHWLMEGAPLAALTEPVGELPQLYSSQVAFVGSIYHPAPDNQTALIREHLLKRVQKQFQLKVWGPQGYPYSRRRWGREQPYPVIEWPTYNEELVKVCRASQIVLGINLINKVRGYFSNRTFLTLASRGFHLTHYVPGLEELFDNHRHLAWYHSHEECLELVQHYLARPHEREMIARNGQEWVGRNYSMDKQFSRLCSITAEVLGA